MLRVAGIITFVILGFFGGVFCGGASRANGPKLSVEAQIDATFNSGMIGAGVGGLMGLAFVAARSAGRKKGQSTNAA